MGNKIDFSWNNDGLGTVKFTQPVLIQKLEDEFTLPNGESPRTQLLPVSYSRKEAMVLNP